MNESYTGIFYVNASTIGAEVHLPFGGTKGTGNGHREAGTQVLDIFSEWKSIYVDYSGKLQRAQIAVEYVGDADLVLALARGRVESVCRRDHHGLIVELELFKHEDGEFLAVANRQLGNNVECAPGLAADRPRYLRDCVAY